MVARAHGKTANPYSSTIGRGIAPFERNLRV
jgi:hypothetical protein